MPRLYKHIQTKQKLIHLQNQKVSKRIHHQRIHIYKLSTGIVFNIISH